MAPEQNGGVQLSTLYMLVMNLYLALLLVLSASAPAEPYWYRYFVMFFLVGMEVAFLVLMLRARKAEQRAREKPPA
jgi:hypothetical protein